MTVPMRGEGPPDGPVGERRPSEGYLRAALAQPYLRRMAAVFLAAGVAYVGAVQMDRARERSRPSVALERVRTEGVVYVPQHGIFVVDVDGRPLAVREDAQHVGDRVLFCRSSGWFQGPHGEGFDRTGAYGAGPASKGLDRVEVRVVGDRAVLDLDRVLSGPARGEMAAQQPVGPLCQEPLVEGPPGFTR